MRSCENLPEMFHVKLFEQGDKSLALRYSSCYNKKA